ncbi:MAG: Imm26 family immunity protein [Phycisphaerae bacterium]|jgi:hypothetical protein
MKKKKYKVEARTVVLVPLKPSGFVQGVVIRSNGRGQAFGCFWGPKLSFARDADFETCRQTSPILVCRFGDYGIRTGRWLLVGPVRDWSDSEWPEPKFWRRHNDPRLCYVSQYDWELKLIAEAVRPMVDAASLPEDVQLGSGVVEAKLSSLVG